jgi:hypothetical protein
MTLDNASMCSQVHIFGARFAAAAAAAHTIKKGFLREAIQLIVQSGASKSTLFMDVERAVCCAVLCMLAVLGKGNECACTNHPCSSF